MNSRILALAACFTAPLLVACPSPSGGGQAETGSTEGVDIPDDTGNPPPPPPTNDGTTEVETSTSDGPPPSDSSAGPGSSSDGGPPPECVTDDDCDNGVFCDGLEGCVEGSCVSAPPMDCNDGVDCTVDSCDDARGACINEPDDTVCGCGETCDTTLGCGNHCVQTECNGQVYQCGNCMDDDGDCAIDNHDTDCWGPCDNNEAGWSGEVPGQQNQSECTAMDCYFDQNSGAGDDDCYWSHTCDPLEPGECAYNPGYSIPGSGGQDCADLQAAQSMDCLDICAPLVPNGCDCFGCCDVTLGDGTQVTIYLGTRDPVTDVATCNLMNAADPVLCNPCTQVNACLNDCGACEICIGQTELPEGCEEQECPPGLAACGQPGQDPCPVGQACITGCCVPEPQ